MIVSRVPAVDSHNHHVPNAPEQSWLSPTTCDVFAYQDEEHHDELAAAEPKRKRTTRKKKRASSAADESSIELAVQQ